MPAIFVLSNLFYVETLNKIQSDGDFHKILLFYDFYGNEDEKIADKLKNAQKKAILIL